MHSQPRIDNNLERQNRAPREKTNQSAIKIPSGNNDEVRNPGSTSRRGDRKSTRLNSSHLGISYAVFFLKTRFEKDMTEFSRGWPALLVRAVRRFGIGVLSEALVSSSKRRFEVGRQRFGDGHRSE